LAQGGSFRVPTSRIPSGLRGEVKVGVRPEKIDIVPVAAPISHDQNSLVGRVMVATFTGVGNQYVVATPSGAEFSVYSQNSGDATAPRPGDEVRLAWLVAHTFAVRASDTVSQEGEES
jgi:spermidine/putrescine transport system ATP-binding protein